MSSPYWRLFCYIYRYATGNIVASLTHSDMSYKRQLNWYTLCVHINVNNKSFMCMHHNTIIRRGGNKVTSCIPKVLNKTLCTETVSYTHLILNYFIDGKVMKVTYEH